MLNVSQQSTYTDSDGYAWQYYPDDVENDKFYIVPRPQFAFANGKPVFQVVVYQTDDKNNGSGYCHIGVELAVPPTVQANIAQQIAQQTGIAQPLFPALPYNPAGTAYLAVPVEGVTTTLRASASAFGSNSAAFVLPLTAPELTSLVQAFSTAGGSYALSYALSVPARLPAVTATLSFDSSIAYQYQVTQPVHHTWGSDTPGYATATLQASQASTVKLDWGIANPPATLETAVTDWANATLAAQVQAQVQEQMQLQGMTSSDSFSISNVSNFTSTYQDNQVIDWQIQPTQVLPSLKDLGLSVADFTATVNERQQAMTVSTNLPFAQDAAAAESQGGAFKALLVKEATVTVTYPGLPDADSTHVFTSNDSAVFSTTYDPVHGPEWQLDYHVTYIDQAEPVKGTIQAISQGDYTLGLSGAGILSVLFDAQQAFAAGTAGPALDQVEIDLQFLNADGSGPGIHQRAVIHATDAVHQATITTLLGVPIDTAYNYTVTYVDTGSMSFQAPTVSGQTGFSQFIKAVDEIHETNIMIVLPANAPDPILNASVNVWYDTPPDLPGISGQPTKAAPQQFQLTPSGQGPYTLATSTFSGFVNGDQPLYYSASINGLNGQIDTGPVMVANTQPTVMISPTDRYFTLQLVPGAIDWTGATFQSVQVIVTASINGVVQAEVSNIWYAGDTVDRYLTWPIQVGDSVSYEWTVNYVTSGAPTTSATGSGSAPIINIPASPVSANAASAGSASTTALARSDRPVAA